MNPLSVKIVYAPRAPNASYVWVTVFVRSGLVLNAHRSLCMAKRHAKNLGYTIAEVECPKGTPIPPSTTSA